MLREDLETRIETLRALLDAHYHPGATPSRQLQEVIDELDDLVAQVMNGRLVEWSSVE